ARGSAGSGRPGGRCRRRTAAHRSGIRASLSPRAAPPNIQLIRGSAGSVVTFPTEVDVESQLESQLAKPPHRLGLHQRASMPVRRNPVAVHDHPVLRGLELLELRPLVFELVQQPVNMVAHVAGFDLAAGREEPRTRLVWDGPSGLADVPPAVAIAGLDGESPG